MTLENGFCRNWLGDKVQAEISGPGGSPLQIDLQAVLLSPANLERLDEAEVLVLRNAVARLCAPVIDGAVETTADVAVGAARDAAATSDGDVDAPDEVDGVEESADG